MELTFARGTRHKSSATGKLDETPAVASRTRIQRGPEMGAATPEAKIWLLTNLVGKGVALALFALLYWGTMASLTRRWDQDANYSHGYLVPIVSGLLLWHRRPENWRRLPIQGGAVAGSLLILFALFIKGLTLLVASLFLESTSMLLALAGVILTLGGWTIGRWFAAPMAFLFFMVPWPSAAYSRLAMPLQLLVSRWSAAALETASIPVLREGNLLHLPGQTMHVAEACSGLRQLTAFLAIGCCAALMAPRPTWHRLAIALSSLPIAVVTNTLRVTLMGVLLARGRASWVNGPLHSVEGMVMVGLGVAMLWGLMRLLDWILESPPVGADGRIGLKAPSLIGSSSPSLFL